MNEIIFFTDPHLGLRRAAHTTALSSARLNECIQNNVDTVLSQCASAKFCLGDVFDTFKVDPNTLIKGAELLQGCDYVLTGNHDVSNRTDQLSSLQALDSILTKEDNDVSVHPVGWDCAVIAVNHQLTQDMFEKALGKAKKLSCNFTQTVLMLHCNYDSPFAVDDASLNLTEETAKDLLKTFAYVLMGHEHQPRTLFDGRLIIIGNVHPTSFSDLSDKYYVRMAVGIEGFHPPEFEKIWDYDSSVLQVNWTELSEIVEIESSIQFITVTGEADPRHLPTIAKQVADLWKLSPKLLMVRNKITALDLVPELSKSESEAQCVSIPDLVADALKDSPLKPLWSHYLERAGYE